MKFSELRNIVRDDAEDWFDPILFEDSLFFVDPFLMYQSNEDLWIDAHDILTNHFNEAIKLIAESNYNSASTKWKKAKRMLTFPEPYEVCLGYAEGSTAGAGSGPKSADAMMDNVVTAVKNGLDGVESFEELALFGKNVGADTISDIVINILKNKFIQYTQAVCKKHDIPTKPFVIRNGKFDYAQLRWVDEKDVMLPKNELLDQPLILVPETFLRDLPKPFIDNRDFWTYAWNNHNEELRDDFNFDIARNVDLSEIERMAKNRPEIVHEFIQSRIKDPIPAYDIKGDPLFITKWWEAGQKIAEGIEVKAPNKPEEFAVLIMELIGVFQHSVEVQGDWRLLVNDDDTPRKEKAIQGLFKSILIHYCKNNNIDISPESNAGQGPVDFKFSQGWSMRALVELKRANNSGFWHGLRVQTTKYLKSEEVKHAFFVAIMQTAADYSEKRDEKAQSVAREVSEEFDVITKVVIIDARPKSSASKA